MRLARIVLPVPGGPIIRMIGSSARDEFWSVRHRSQCRLVARWTGFCEAVITARLARAREARKCCDSEEEGVFGGDRPTPVRPRRGSSAAVVRPRIAGTECGDVQLRLLEVACDRVSK